MNMNDCMSEYIRMKRRSLNIRFYKFSIFYDFIIYLKKNIYISFFLSMIS